MIGIALYALAMSFREALARPASFFWQLLLMVVNDVTWVVFWWVIFRHADDIRGWEIDDVMVMFAIFATSVGISFGIFNGLADIPRYIRDGRLDHLLTQPGSPLVRIAVSRINPAMMGDLVFGPILFSLTSYSTPAGWAIFTAAALCSATVLLGFSIAVRSSVFFLRGRDEASTTAIHSMSVLAMYPATFFGGAFKLLMFTLVPAAFVSTLPATAIINQDPMALFAVLAAGLTIIGIGTGCFQLGTRRYSRGAT